MRGNDIEIKEKKEQLQSMKLTIKTLEEQLQQFSQNSKHYKKENASLQKNIIRLEKLVYGHARRTTNKQQQPSLKSDAGDFCQVKLNTASKAKLRRMRSCLSVDSDAGDNGFSLTRSGKVTTMASTHKNYKRL